MKTFFKLTIIIFLTIFFTHCGKDSDDIRCIDQDLINQNIDTACLEVYEPVCGCNIGHIQMNVTREKQVLHPMWMVNVIKLKRVFKF